jgi:ankyrin repeat protein
MALAVGAVGMSAAERAHAQTPPSAAEIAAYTGLHAAAAQGDVAAAQNLLRATPAADPNARDGHGRTPAHVAAHRGHGDILRVLKAAGGDLNALDQRRYDVITIAAVRDDAAMVRLAIGLGARATNVTSPYDGTALIAAAHLGHDDVVRALIEGGAPLNHVNVLGWTAVMEAVVLGDGMVRHQRTLRALLDAGADATIPDREGITALRHAERRGYVEMVAMLRRTK